MSACWLQDRDRFDVRGMRKHVDDTCRAHTPSSLVMQDRAIARECCRVAGNVNKPTRRLRAMGQNLRDGDSAFAWWVEQHATDAAHLVDEPAPVSGLELEKISAQEAGVRRKPVQSCRACGTLEQRRAAFDADHTRGAACQRQGKVAQAAEKVDDAVV